MPERTTLSGTKELEAVLKQLPKEIGIKVLAKATRAGAAVVKKDADARLESSGVSKRGGRKGKPALGIVRDRKGTASVTFLLGIHKSRWYLIFREFGTAPHKIMVKRAEVLGSAATGRIFGTEVDHPGQRARPFMRPAIDSKADDALLAMGRVMGKETEKAALKLAGRFRNSGLARKRRR